MKSMPPSRRWILVALLTASGAAAQPRLPGDVPSRVEAFVRMRQARDARQRGDLEEAVRLLREAVEMGAPPSSLRELAEVLEQQQRYRLAAGAWTRYSALAERPEEQRRAIERRESLRRTPTVLRVRVTPPEAARIARVWFDRDAPRWYAAGGLESLAEGGVHRVRVEANGYQPWEMMVPTSFGDPVEVVAVMAPPRR